MNAFLQEGRKTFGKGVAFLESAFRLARGDGNDCPSCGGKPSEKLDSKYFIFQLRRCGACGLQYRTPTTPPARSEHFYQRSYIQGEQSWMPSSERLNRLCATGFEGSGLSYAFHISLLQALGAKKGTRLFDFGCSWGYGSWQFAQAGFDVTAFEISRPRREFAKERLGVKTCDSMESAGTAYDIFFAAHVLEHVPSVEAVFRMARAILKPGGMMLMITPNGSDAYRKRNPLAWHLAWGQVHPNFLDDVFYEKRWSGMPYLLTSSPYDLERLGTIWREIREGQNLGVEGNELLLMVKF